MARNSLQYLTTNDWSLIATKSKRIVFRLGEEIVRQGDPGNMLYVIRRGSASVELPDAQSQTVIALLERDDVCGDMAFLERAKATASVIAKDDEVEVEAIQAADLRDLFESFPRLATRFYQSMAVILARRLRHTSRELVRVINTARLLAE